MTTEEIWVFVKQQWPALFALLGVGQLWRTRREHVLRSRLQLGVEIYDVFAALNDAVLRGANVGGEENAVFLKKLEEIYPKAELMLHRAELILSPDMATELGEILEIVGRTHMHRGFHDVLMHSVGVDAQRHAALKLGREHLPQKMEAANRRLMYLLHRVTVGWLRAWWWWQRRDKVEKKRAIRRQTHLEEESAVAKRYEEEHRRLLNRPPE